MVHVAESKFRNGINHFLQCCVKENSLGEKHFVILGHLKASSHASNSFLGQS